MSRSCVYAEQLAIEHVRKPCQGMPVARVLIRERPLQTPPTQSGADGGILKDIIVVIVINKTVMARGPVNRQRSDYQCKARQPEPSAVGPDFSHSSIVQGIESFPRFFRSRQSVLEDAAALPCRVTGLG